MTVFLKGCAHRINSVVGPGRGGSYKHSPSNLEGCAHQPREGERTGWVFEKGKEFRSRDQISWSMQAVSEVRDVAHGFYSYADIL